MENLIPSVVAAMSAGALAAAKGLGGEILKDAYGALKTLIADRYKKAEAAVEALESDPASELEQAVLQKRLETEQAGDDTELAVLAQTLLERIEALEQSSEAAALLDFDKLRSTGAFELHNVEVGGTVLRARDARFEGDFSAKDLRQKN